MKTNVLYYGDNLEILRNRGYFPDESIDLIYLDPPFSSKKDYNILFKESSGQWSEAQIKAFSDTWHWNEAAENTYQDIRLNAPLKVGKLIEAMVEGIGRNDVMAYLVMMTVRLSELHRVLKKTGSLYLHCDPTASHYLKLILDQIFGARNFRNEIVWCYTSPGHSKRDFQRKHDTILRYSKSESYTFNEQFVPYKSGIHVSKEGEILAYKGTIKPSRALEYERRGKPVEDWWTDIYSADRVRKEMLGYPTQKPRALLERIIKASSNEGDVVLDPFCGCGTAIVAAEKAKRRWIGIDITHLAIAVMRSRLKDSFGIESEAIGEPVDVASARALARQDRYQFQWWALSLVKARPVSPERKKGADAGIDGFVPFLDDHAEKTRRAVVQVKSGHVGVKDIRELKDVASKEALGVFITLQPPTRDMEVAALGAGQYHSPLWDRDYPKIQILTIEELLQGKTVNIPLPKPPFPKAAKISREQAEQLRNL